MHSTSPRVPNVQSRALRIKNLEIINGSRETLTDAFYETPKDVYFAGKQSVRACKKSASAASRPNSGNAPNPAAQ